MAAKKNTLPAKAASSDLAVSAGGDFSDYAGQGMESVTARDMLVPRLSILQALSPQISKQKAEYIEGAEIGVIADIGLRMLFPGGVVFLPVKYDMQYLEWAPRSSGKGLIDIHPTADILEQTSRDDKKRNVLPNGNYIAETAQWYGINLTAGRQRCFIPMTSTQLKKSRMWMTMATSEKLQRGDGSEFTPPLFYRTYNLGTGPESNSEGEWYGWTIDRGAALPEIAADAFGTAWHNIKDEAVEFYQSLSMGTVKADLREMEDVTPSSGEGAM